VAGLRRAQSPDDAERALIDVARALAD